MKSLVRQGVLSVDVGELQNSRSRVGKLFPAKDQTVNVCESCGLCHNCTTLSQCESRHRQCVSAWACLCFNKTICRNRRLAGHCWSIYIIVCANLQILAFRRVVPRSATSELPESLLEIQNAGPIRPMNCVCISTRSPGDWCAQRVWETLVQMSDIYTGTRAGLAGSKSPEKQIKTIFLTLTPQVPTQRSDWGSGSCIVTQIILRFENLWSGSLGGPLQLSFCVST